MNFLTPALIKKTYKMTPKEKALEIANAMYNGSVFDKTKEQHLLEIKNAKRCALICIEQVRQFNKSLFYASKGSLFDLYLDEVKNEIINL